MCASLAKVASFFTGITDVSSDRAMVSMTNSCLEDHAKELTVYVRTFCFMCHVLTRLNDRRHCLFQRK